MLAAMTSIGCSNWNSEFNHNVSCYVDYGSTSFLYLNQAAPTLKAEVRSVYFWVVRPTEVLAYSCWVNGRALKLSTYIENLKTDDLVI